MEVKKQMKEVMNERGSLHYIFFVFLFLFCLMGAALLNGIKSWENLMSVQLKVDRCVGTHAQKLVSLLSTIAQTNQAIQGLRVASAASTLLPPAKPPLLTLIRLIARYQDIMLLRWSYEVQKWKWMRGCGEHKSFFGEREVKFLPLPQMKFYRKMPDPLGEQALEWGKRVSSVGGIPEKMPRQFFIQLVELPRGAAAVIYPKKGKVGKMMEVTSSIPLLWKAQWKIPKKLK